MRGDVCSPARCRRGVVIRVVVRSTGHADWVAGAKQIVRPSGLPSRYENVLRQRRAETNQAARWLCDAMLTRACP